MAVNINRVILVGQLTKDPEVKELPSGTKLANLRIAVNTRRKSEDGAIRAERKARKWSRARLAEELKVSVQTIYRWETGHPPSKTMQHIAAYVLGWEGQTRKWVVTFVVQDVVMAKSAAEAASKANMSLEEAGYHKHQTYAVRVVK